MPVVEGNHLLGLSRGTRKRVGLLKKRVDREDGPGEGVGLLYKIVAVGSMWVLDEEGGSGGVRWT